MTLHIISGSPGLGSDTFSQGFKIATKSDAILLTGNAVYAAIQYSEQHSLLESASCSIYALKDDLLARGVTVETNFITVIDYPQWVQLTVEHENCISWFE